MGGAATPSYEEVRKQRVEANNRRMEVRIPIIRSVLGLKDMSRTLSKTFVESNLSPMVRKVKYHNIKDNASIVLRRSSRVAGTPQPDYRETDFEILALRRGSCRSRLLPRKYCSDKARFVTAEAAEELEKSLDSGCPSFVKLMLQSHVSGGFWLGLPSVFCQRYLPNKDTVFILEDSKGLEWETLYLAYKTGLSGGWRGFSIDHELEDGDALVFELVKAHRFKVHIVRADDDVATAETKAAPKNTTNDLTSCKSPLETSHVGPTIVKHFQNKSGASKGCPSKKQKMNDKDEVVDKLSQRKLTSQNKLFEMQNHEIIDIEMDTSKDMLKEENKTKLGCEAPANRTRSDTTKSKPEPSSTKSKLEPTSSFKLETGRLRTRKIAPQTGKIIDMLPGKKPYRHSLTAMVKA
ncbi:hypothetical protein O6H91_11G086100 [Diphasiastrum complanatum]|uniref:Uncharacterized protein n=1 Tax=Diphasiastrum complanatum TaxID=34168 RepID=A0ACC2CBQ3_DIPCM|nr:hypothetical protein O6H91_11G086100 [Diphasiastrum complanatum]